MATNIYNNLIRANSDLCYSRSFKLVESKNCATTFLPLNTILGQPVKYFKDKETICLTINQARHTYKKVKSESVVNIDTMKQEIEDKLGRNNTDDGKCIPHHDDYK